MTYMGILNKKLSILHTYDSMAVWWHDSVTLWQYDSMGVWQCGSLTARQCDSMAVWFCDSMAACNCDGMAVWQFDRWLILLPLHQRYCQVSYGKYEPVEDLHRVWPKSRTTGWAALALTLSIINVNCRHCSNTSQLKTFIESMAKILDHWMSWICGKQGRRCCSLLDISLKRPSPKTS